jgi:YggT family protein
MIYTFIYRIVDVIFQALYILLLIRVILSWIPHNDSHPIVYKIYELTDPILRPFQNIIPSWRLGIDLSPLFAFMAIRLAQKLITMLFF